MKKYNEFTYLLFVVLLVVQVTAQDDYQKWLQKQSGSYQGYLQEEDKKFIGFLEKEWKGYGIEKGIKAEEKPKPVSLPVFKPIVKPKTGELKPNQPVKPAENIPETKLKEVTEEKTEDLMPPVSPAQNSIAFNFYGIEEGLNIPLNKPVTLKGDLSNKTISEFWKEQSGTDFKKYIDECSVKLKKYGLNDWGFLMLLNKVSKRIYPGSVNEQILFTWFLLNKSGKKAKIGIVDKRALLLLPIKHRLYQISYISEGNDKFYIINPDNVYEDLDGEISTYEGDFDKSSKTFDMSISGTLSLNGKRMTKELAFNDGKENRAIKVSLDESLINFYKDYPNTELDVYFTAKVENRTLKLLIEELKPLVKDKSELDAVNFLLHFSQTAFGYKTDDVNFNREKPLFVEETLFYNFSDCEDRSILFAYLVKELLGLDVVGLDFPGHVNTAVKFTKEINGGSITFKNKKYTICDPTFMGADAGMVMDSFKNTKPERIVEVK